MAAARKATIGGLVVSLVLVNGKSLDKGGSLAPVRQWVGLLVAFGMIGLIAEVAPPVGLGFALTVPLVILLDDPTLPVRLVKLV